jgi:hypothetical protein
VSDHETPAETQPLQFDRVITASDSSDVREKLALLYETCLTLIGRAARTLDSTFAGFERV